MSSQRPGRTYRHRSERPRPRLRSGSSLAGCTKATRLSLARAVGTAVTHTGSDSQPARQRMPGKASKARASKSQGAKFARF